MPTYIRVKKSRTSGRATGVWQRQTLQPAEVTRTCSDRVEGGPLLLKTVLGSASFEEKLSEGSRPGVFTEEGFRAEQMPPLAMLASGT